MAAKAKAKPAKTRQKPLKGVKASKRSSLPKMTPVQFKAYQKARQSAIQKAQFRDAVARLQRRRLQGAAKAERKLAVKLQQAISARIKARAVRATYQQNVSGHQARILRLATARRLFQAQSVATQHQFAYLGERIHKRTTVLQTVTTKQGSEQVTAQRLRAAQRRARLRHQKLPKGPKKKVGRPKGKHSISPAARAAGKAQRARYNAIGRAAGLAAARHVSTAQAASPKKKPAKAKVRKAAGDCPELTHDWVTAGNDRSRENCITVAMANHLLLHTGYRMDDGYVHALHRVTDGTIEDALWWAWTGLWWDGTRIYDYEPLEIPEPGCLIGFGDHAAVLLGNDQMISWGSVVPMKAGVEEAWRIRWTLGDDNRSPRGPGDLHLGTDRACLHAVPARAG